MKRFILPRLFLLSAFLVWMQVSCFAIVKTAVVNGNWSNAFNWFPSGIPASNDSIIIDAYIYYDIPITITAGGSVTILFEFSLCGQDSFKMLCGSYFTNNGTMSGVYIGVSDGITSAGSWTYASNLFVAYPCSSGFINNGMTIVGLPFSCNPTAVNEIKPEADLIIFPNPFSNNLDITADNKEALEIVLYDFISRKCMKNTFTHSLSLNTELLERGIYFYEVRNKNGIIKSGKIIKE